MASLNVKVAVSTRGSSNPESVPVTDVSKSQMRDAVSISAFGDEADAKRFLRENRQKLNQLGFSDEAEIMTLTDNQTGEVLGAYLRSRPQMTADDAEDALDDLL